MDVVKYGNALDRYWPYKQGQLVTIVGHPNVGKTTVIIWIASLLAKKGKKGLVYSAENRISSLHRDFLRFYTGRATIEPRHMQECREMMTYIINKRSFNYREILEQAMCILDAGFEWDFFIIDPYNSLSIHNPDKLSMHDYHYFVADYMRLFCMNADKTIFLNCHTLTESQRERLDNNGERKAPIASFVEGGAKFINKSDDVIVLHRNPKSTVEGRKYVTEIHVDKIRHQEFGGEPTPAEFPIELKLRMDRTGFDIISKPPQSIEIKQMNFYEKEKDDLPF
jgi:hypothetical protein